MGLNLYSVLAGHLYYHREKTVSALKESVICFSISPSEIPTYMTMGILTDNVKVLKIFANCSA